MIEYGDWSISASGFGTHPTQYLESVFSQSNGYIGARAAFLQDGALPHERCTYLAGGYEYISPGITDLVNLPDPFHCLIRVADSCPGQDTGRYTAFRQQLSFNDGLYIRQAIWQDGQGRETAVTLSRFVSMADKHIAALRLELTALNHNERAEVLLGLDAGTLNLPVHDDQMLVNQQTVKLLRVLKQSTAEEECSLTAQSWENRLAIDIRCRVTQTAGTRADASAPDCPAHRLIIPLKQGQTALVEKLIAINAPEGSPTHDFDTLLAESRKAWELRWRNADIVVETEDAKVQTALRYNLFQLMQSRPFGDPTVSIGARGLTHARYKGCYFWDTDIFLLPFFLYTDPAAARDLVRFRLDTLPDARENAARLSLRGARYPWMCAVGGKEQCHTWDIGRSEIHITADVAFAADQYLRVTGDEGLRAAASQMFIETARYWASRFTYDAREDVYNLLFVKGPDEYCGVSSNNAYTVLLARHNLMLAIKAAEDSHCGKVTENSHDEVAALKAAENNRDIAVTPEELATWREIIKKSCVTIDIDKDLYIQDDDFLRLEPFDMAARQEHAPLYRTLDFDRLQRYRVLKQADLLLLMLLLPDFFTEHQKQALWDCYEPITLHDSSLSFGIHSWAAAVLNKPDKAEEYFHRSLFLDLENLLGNTGTEGIHMAALGATWQAVVFGFAGLSMGKDGKPALFPRLPTGWRSLRFYFYAGGIRYQAEVTGGDGVYCETEIADVADVHRPV